MFLGIASPRIEDRLETIAIVPLGNVSNREIAVVRQALFRTFNLRVVVTPRRPLPKETYYRPRHRYRAEHLVAWLAKGATADKTIGVTARDISTTARGHRDWGIAGLATLGGSSAVVSSFRAKDRLDEVVVHEIGHTLGLPHCPNAGCAMQDADGKIKRIGRRFCVACRAKIAAWLR